MLVPEWTTCCSLTLEAANSINHRDMRLRRRIIVTAATARWAISTALALTLFSNATQRALAQDPFFKGKTINLVVGYSAGGGYDQYARLAARHLGRHIPGNPTVIVQNMPGAASMTSVRYLDANAPKDGTVVTMFDPRLLLEALPRQD